MFGVEFVEAALVFSLVLGDAGVAGDQRVDRFGGGTDTGEELVGFDVQVGGVELGAHGLVDQLVDLVPVGEEVVDGVEERCCDLLVTDVRRGAWDAACVFVVAPPDAFLVFRACMPGFRPVPGAALPAPDLARERPLPGCGAPARGGGSQFCLDEVPHGWGDDRLMVAGDVVLGYFAFVLDQLLGEEVGDVGLLQQRVTFVFLVGEDAAHLAG
ncbi:Uncharacterised protein [Chlamydia trachomatis]|nr:Uncharacterised protein [Chlamydia trachomatis]CRH93761.1 Uncharacterised protein [Chlamydia trachomatis]